MSCQRRPLSTQCTCEENERRKDNIKKVNLFEMMCWSHLVTRSRPFARSVDHAAVDFAKFRSVRNILIFNFSSTNTNLTQFSIKIFHRPIAVERIVIAFTNKSD